MAHCRPGTWHLCFSPDEELPNKAEGHLTTCIEMSDPDNLLYLYKKYYFDSDELEVNTMNDEKPYVPVNYDTGLKTDFPLNRIVFGAPGTGKSFELEVDRKKLLNDETIGDYEHNRNNLHVNLYNVEYVDYVELQEVTVKQVYVNDLPGADIAFDILAEADFTVRQYNNRYGEKEEDATKWFKFSCKGNLENNLDDCIVKDPEEYLSKPQPSKPLDDSLVPYIHKEEYDTVAADFLKAANCEKCITSAVPVDAMKIVSALGLNVKSVNLSRDRSIFGRIYFCDDEVEIYNDSDEPETVTVKGKTILVDPLANYLKTLGQLDNTIIHECFHWYKHKKAYELERLYNKDATSIGCLVVGGVQGDTRKATEWMERQANAITPRIQMPIAGFKQHVSDLIAKYKATIAAKVKYFVEKKIIVDF